MVYWIQQALNALQLGCIYALIALGYSMVYGILSMINFAHGDLFMLGAFACFALATFLHLPFLPVLLLSMAAVALLGAGIERFAYRPLREAPKVSAVITALGVGIFLENLTLALNPYPRPVPALLPAVNFCAGGLYLSFVQVLIIGVSVGLMLALEFVVGRTRLGLAMRAVSWDRRTAPLLGVPVNTVISATFAMGSALGAAAGVLYAMAYPVIDPYMGVWVGWKAFISAVVGGIGSLRGAVAGGLILGAAEVGVAAFLPSTYRDFVAFGLLWILLLVRPYGLFGTPRMEKV